MDIKRIQDELDKIQNSAYANKTDKQLQSYEALAAIHREKYKGTQPASLVPFNDRRKRKCKLSPQEVNEIRSKYNPYFYGKLRLAKEYGVSGSLIYRIIKNKIWRE